MTATISVVGSVIAIIVSVAGIFRNHRMDHSNDGREMGQIMTELGYIKSSLDTINQTVGRQEERHIGLIKDMNNINGRVSLLESYQTVSNNTFDNINKQLDSLQTNVNDLKMEVLKLQK